MYPTFETAGGAKESKKRNNGAHVMANRLVEVSSLILADLLALFILMFLAYLVRLHIIPVFIPGLPQGISTAHMVQIAWFPFLSILAFAFSGLYTRRFPWMQETGLLVKGGTFSMLIALAVLFILKESSQVSRLLILLTGANSLWLLPLARLAAKKIMTGLGFWLRPVIVIGAGKAALQVSLALDGEASMGYRVLGIVLPGLAAPTDTVGDIPVLGSWPQMEEILAATGVRDVVIAVPDIHGEEMAELAAVLHRRVENVLFVPDIYGLPVMGADIGFFFNQRTLVINFRNNLVNPFNLAAKRLFDIAAGVVLTVLLLPVFTACSACVLLDSGRPVFYIQKRLGRNGRIFGCIKYRTMLVGKELNEILEDRDMAVEWESGQKVKRDPRVTRVGRLLRRLSLDELPQLLNVVAGDMSLVGPRPVVAEEIKKYGRFKDYYYSVRPGLSGLWQVSGRNDVDYETRVMLDSWYVRNWSLWLDLYILGRTIKAVIRGEGAY